MYHTIKIMVRPNDEIYSYLDEVAHLSNNLYNATMFRIRQVFTAINKQSENKAITENEQTILQELQDTFPIMGDRYQMPSKGKTFLSYYFLDCLLKRSKNPDYLAEKLPRKCAQHTLKQAVKDMKSFYALLRLYKANKNALTGRPRLPRYKKKGGACTFYLTNQEAHFVTDKNLLYLKFAKTDLRLPLGDSIQADWKLKEVSVCPYHDVFFVHIKVDDGKTECELTSESRRVCSIDLGIDNFAAITTNTGIECLLIKGGVIKSANQWYNKRYAQIQSAQTEGTTNKFHSTPESDRLCIKRENIMSDFMHKAAKLVINWCIRNNIDTIVIGNNTGWKQNANIGKKENQKFVEIPYDRFKFNLAYLCERHGIRFVRQEESYTSKASFRMQDNIPVYGENDAGTVRFSGKRAPTEYKGNRKASGFRGLYKDGDGYILNSDLNGSANIGRKAFPDLFTPESVQFEKVIIIRHPDKCTM